MSWSRENFLAILETHIAKNLLADQDIADYVQTFSEDNKAALLHANDVSKASDVNEKLNLLQLVAAFAQKNIKKITSLAITKKVSVGARLDYLLPLHDANFQAGEDIFVAAVKILFCDAKTNPLKNNILLKTGQLIHKVGDDKDKPYSAKKLKETEEYVNSSFIIRKILQAAPNKTIIKPNLDALNYILTNAKTYQDSNQNPVIVFIAGAISIDGYSTSSLIHRALQHGANINDVGFFGVPGIVWATILADVAAVNTFLANNAALDIEDEMGNHHVAAWTAAAQNAAMNSRSYTARALETFHALGDSENCQPNFSDKTPNDYLAMLRKRKTFSIGLSRQTFFKPTTPGRHHKKINDHLRKISF